MSHNKVLESALRLLARREHSARELTDKLIQKGHASDDVRKVVADCQHQGLQSDKRYCESIMRSRSRLGYGPIKIIQELRAKDVDETLIEIVFAEEDIDWISLAQEVWKKKCQGREIKDFVQLQKLKRFLQYRGFSSEQIQQAASNASILE